MQLFVQIRNIVNGFMPIRPWNQIYAKQKLSHFFFFSREKNYFQDFRFSTYMLCSRCYFPFSIRLVQCPMEYQLCWIFAVPFRYSTTSIGSGRVAKSCTRRTKDSTLCGEVLSLLDQLTCLKSKEIYAASVKAKRKITPENAYTMNLFGGLVAFETESRLKTELNQHICWKPSVSMRMVLSL